MPSPKSYNLMHLDAAENIFFARELENIAKELYNKQYPELKGRSLVASKSDMHPATEMHTYRTFDFVGRAKRITDHASDLPAVSTFGAEVSQRIDTYGDSFRYTKMEIAAANMMGRSLDSSLAFAARQALEQTLDDIVASGDSDAGLSGLLSLAAASGLEYTLPADGDTSSKLWSLKTPDQILRDCNGMRTKVSVDSKGVESVKRMVFPIGLYNRMESTPRASGSDMSILNWLKSNMPGIEIMSWERLADAGAAGVDRILGYNPDPSKVHLLMPQDVLIMPPEPRNLAYVTNLYLRTGGVVSPYPKSMIFADGAADTSAGT